MWAIWILNKYKSLMQISRGERRKMTSSATNTSPKKSHKLLHWLIRLHFSDWDWNIGLEPITWNEENREWVQINSFLGWMFFFLSIFGQQNQKSERSLPFKIFFCLTHLMKRLFLPRRQQKDRIFLYGSPFNSSRNCGLFIV